MTDTGPGRRPTTWLERVFTSPLRELILLALIVGALVVVGVVTHHGGSTTASTNPGHPSTSPGGGSSTSGSPQPVQSAGPPLQLLHFKCIPQTKQATIKVVTYNIKSGHYENRSQLAGISEDLKAADPDIVLLQEVDNNRVWTGHVDEPKTLASSLGYQDAYGVNVLRAGDSQYGTAILSRFPILSEQNVHLPNRPGLQQRGLLRITVKVHGIPMDIYTTHLQNTSRSMRVVQMAAVVRMLSEDHLPKIIGGDLNDTPDSPVLREAYSSLYDTWNVVGVGSGPTVPSGAPRARIDYLLYGQGTDESTQITPLSAQVLDAVNSDHRAVEATYRISERAKPVCVPTN